MNGGELSLLVQCKTFTFGLGLGWLLVGRFDYNGAQRPQDPL